MYTVNLTPFLVGDDRGTGEVREAGEERAGRGVLQGRKAGKRPKNYAAMLNISQSK